MSKRKIPIAIILLGLLVSSVRFFVLRSSENEHIRSIMNSESDALLYEITLALEARAQVIERMARRIEMKADAKVDQNEREAEGFAVYRHLPGFQAFELTDAEDRVRWVYPVEGNQEDLSSDLKKKKRMALVLEKSTQTGSEMLASPIPLEESSYGFAIVCPLYTKSELPFGHFVGLLRNDSFFNSLHLRKDIFINVIDQSVLVYSNEISDESVFEWRVKKQISYLNADWQLHFTPSRSFLEENRSVFPVISSILTSLVFLLLAFIFMQTQEKRRSEIKFTEERRLNEMKSFNSVKLASIGEMAAGVCHEISNPLTIIKGFSYRIRHELTQEIPDPKRIQQIIEFVERQDNAINRIAEIVDGLRIFARVDAETIEIFDIHKTITDTVRLLEYIHRTSDIQISLSLNAEHSFVRGNAGNVRQVIMSFLSNSAYALMKRRNKTIEIKTENVDRSIVLKFIDNGHGISEENIQRIFEPFFTTKAPGEGVGLGLGISYGVISNMKGTIEVQSTLEEGAVFSVTLPYEDPEKLDA